MLLFPPRKKVLTSCEGFFSSLYSSHILTGNRRKEKGGRKYEKKLLFEGEEEGRNLLEPLFEEESVFKQGRLLACNCGKKERKIITIGPILLWEMYSSSFIPSSRRPLSP